MLKLVESERKDPTGRVSTSKTPLTVSSVFPDDAVAVIYRPARSAMTSGKANTRHWKLRFERRTPPFIEPLMGWTGGDDPLTQVELTFPTRESAVAYAERQGLTFIVQGQDYARHGPDHARSAPRDRSTDEVCEERAPPVDTPLAFVRAASSGDRQSA
jgi:hypothetical protein